MTQDMFTLIMNKCKNKLEFYNIVLQNIYPEPLQGYLIDQAVLCLQRTKLSTIYSDTFEKYHINNLISLYSKIKNKKIKIHLFAAVIHQNKFCTDPNFIDAVCDDIKNNRVVLEELYAFPFPENKPILEKFYNVVFDYWVRHKCRYAIYTAYFLSYSSTLEKYEKYKFKNLYYSYITTTSKLTIEQLSKKLNEPLSEVVRSCDLTTLPIEKPVELFKLTQSLRDRCDLVKNPCLTSNDLMTIWTLTKSQQIKEILLHHKSCPDTLKLKSNTIIIGDLKP